MISDGYDQKDALVNPRNPRVVEVTPAGDVVFTLQVEDTTEDAYRGGRVDLFHPGG
jgi:hypothetical protein